jgi:hypothetical protein
MSIIRTTVVIVATIALLPITLCAQDSAQRSSHGVINQKAAAVRSADRNAITQEVDAVILIYPLSKDLIGLTGSMHDSLVASEVSYQQDKHPGVSEAAVVRAVNRLARMVKAPAWTYTSERQVQRLRASMIAYMPSFIGKGPATRKLTTLPTRLSSQMSPAESVYVLSSLVYQKMNNPEWQVTPEEERALWSARHARDYVPNFADHRRSDELRGLIQEATQHLSLRDAQQVVNGALADLGLGGAQ